MTAFDAWEILDSILERDEKRNGGRFPELVARTNKYKSYEDVRNELIGWIDQLFAM